MVNINILLLFVKVSVEEEGVIEVTMTLEVSEVNFTCQFCEYFSNFMHYYQQNFAPLVFAHGLGGAGGGGSFSNRGGRGGSSGFSDSRGNRGSYGHFEEGGGGGGREWSRGGRGGYGGRSRPDSGRERRHHSDEFKEPAAGKNVTGPY